MEAIRKIKKSDSDEIRIKLPKNFINRELEVIIFPIETGSSEIDKTKTGFIKKILANPLKINDFEPIKRDKIYER